MKSSKKIAQPLESQQQLITILIIIILILTSFPEDCGDYHWLAAALENVSALIND